MAWVQCPPLPLCAAPPLSLGAQRALLSGEGQQLGAERWEGAAGGGALSQERPQGKSRRGATAPKGQAGKHRCGPAPREPPIRRTGGSLVSRCTALHGAGPPVTRLVRMALNHTQAPRACGPCGRVHSGSVLQA